MHLIALTARARLQVRRSKFVRSKLFINLIAERPHILTGDLIHQRLCLPLVRLWMILQACLFVGAMWAGSINDQVRHSSEDGKKKT
jgi:hypothetical protein